MNFAPHDYQAYAIDYIETHPVAAVLLDMGLGKTVISLTAIADLLFDSFEAHRILVVAPLRVARDTWPAEIRKWQHLKHLTFAVCVGTPKERKGPGTNYDKTGQFTGKGIFTIVQESKGEGATLWGKLKSGAGWISLDFAKKL